MEINQILTEVKKNRKYKSISDEIVLKEINNYQNSNKNNKITKQSIKDIRARLHRIYASYQTTKKSKRIKYLDPLNPEKILSTNRSTKERLTFYKDIYNKIFQITGKPNTIVDIASGLNPVSFHYMNVSKIKYYAYDIDIEDINFLNEYFKTSKIDGKAEILDINNINNVKKIPNSDIIFMFKLLDLVERKENYLEQLILSLLKKTKYIIASFSTKTLSGKNMKLRRRTGFEFMLKKNNLNFNLIEEFNEIFYVIYE